jgi:hypothetical protein
MRELSHEITKQGILFLKRKFMSPHRRFSLFQTFRKTAHKASFKSARHFRKHIIVLVLCLKFNVVVILSL